MEINQTQQMGGRGKRFFLLLPHSYLYGFHPGSFFLHLLKLNKNVPLNHQIHHSI
jgi:hypothetical protein